MSKTDAEHEWLVSGMIIYKKRTYLVAVPWPDLIMDSFAFADSLAAQQDEMAAGASTPAMRITFEENARGIRLWADGYTDFDEYGRPLIGRPLVSMSPFLARRAQQENLLVIPSNVEDYMAGLMKRAVGAKSGAALSFVLQEQQVETFGPLLYATEEYDFLHRFATRGVICQVVSKEDLSEFRSQRVPTALPRKPSAPKELKGLPIHMS